MLGEPNVLSHQGLIPSLRNKLHNEPSCCFHPASVLLPLFFCHAGGMTGCSRDASKTKFEHLCVSSVRISDYVAWELF